MIDMNAFNTFITTVKLGNMTKAAKALGVSVQTISRSLNEIEKSRNCKLFYKKKPLVLSPVGERYYQQLNGVFGQTIEAITQLDNEYNGEQGQLTIHAPYNFTRVVLSDALIDFAIHYPNIKVNSVAKDDTLQVDTEGADIAFALVDDAPDDWIAKKIGHFTSGLYASPRYLAKSDNIQSLEELEHHQIIIHEHQKEWLLTNDHQQFSFKRKQPAFTANQMEILYQATIKGLGIAHLVDWVAKPFVEAGELVPILPQWKQQRSAYLLYPHRSFLPKRSKCFIDFIVPKLKAFEDESILLKV
ncbi:MAG: hypothetical protein COB83_10795 [Gammaproteobacteria bacterium]|nr:MAG: hypothetical protein COB83_10795 [Gammaproteobacteria bacterium]